MEKKVLFGRLKGLLSKKDLKMAEEYGGSDFEDWLEYEEPNGVPSPDKGGHKERSIFHNPSHLKHWKEKDR